MPSNDGGLEAEPGFLTERLVRLEVRLFKA
jgi:hypothetical protein